MNKVKVIMENLEKFKDTLQSSKNILILTHVNPDGDTLSSALVLYLALKDNYSDLKIDITYTSKIPNIYMFLPKISEFQNIEDLDQNKIYDAAIAIDVAAKDRMVYGLKLYEKSKIKINIDHHKTNNKYGDINIIKSDYASCSQVVFDILKYLNINIKKEYATAIYTGLLTDTGGFRYENTDFKVLSLASKLIEYGADPYLISKACYESKDKAQVLLHSYCILNSVFYDELSLVYTVITKETMEKFKAQDQHTEGLVEKLRQINTIDIAIVLKESSDHCTKISLRSKTKDVSKIASNFNGGGHKFASGCTIKKNYKAAILDLIDIIRKYNIKG